MQFFKSTSIAVLAFVAFAATPSAELVARECKTPIPFRQLEMLQRRLPPWCKYIYTHVVRQLTLEFFDSSASSHEWL